MSVSMLQLRAWCVAALGYFVLLALSNSAGNIGVDACMEIEEGKDRRA